MKRTILIIALILLSFGNFAQDKKTKVENKLTILKDSVTLDKIKNQSVTKIFLTTPKKEEDYFKYIFPVITLLLGIGVNKLIDYQLARKKIKKSGKRWLSELIILEKPIEMQVENINTFLVEHDKPTFTFPRPVLVTALDCEIFSTLDKTDLIEYLQKIKNNSYENAVKKAAEISSYITILKSHYDNFRKHFEEYKSNVSDYTTTISRNLQGLQKEFVKYGVSLEEELGKDPINDKRYRPILDLFNAEILPYMQNGKYDIYKLERDFLTPMIFVLSELRLDSRTVQMRDYIQNSLTEIKGIKLEKTYISENFTTIKDWYIESKSDLPKIITILK